MKSQNFCNVFWFYPKEQASSLLLSRARSHWTCYCHDFVILPVKISIINITKIHEDVLKLLKCFFQYHTKNIYGALSNPIGEPDNRANWYFL